MRKLVMLWLTLGAAHADRASDALTRLDRGIALYEGGQLEAARAELEAARDLVPDRPNPHRWLGLVEARLHHCKEAIVELELFITRTPPEDPRRGEAAAVRDQCRGELAPQLGTLVIDSPGAEVRLDDPNAPPLGKSPQQAQLVEGRHVAYLSRPGFLGRSLEVQIVAGKVARLDAELQPLSAGSAAPPKRRSRAWIAGVVVGVVVVGVAVGLGLGLGLSREPAPVAIPPIMGAL